MRGGEALKGHLDMLLLAAVEAGAAHGYAISAHLRSSSEGVFDLADGTIYPALHRLERGGYIKGRWTATGGRRRKTYALTKKGERLLSSQRRDWDAFQRGVRAVLSRAS